MNKQLLARIAGWGQLAVEYINEVIQANGGLLPTNRAGWSRLAVSLLIAFATHHASATSAENPTGHK